MVAERKIKELENLKNLIKKYRVVAIGDMHNVPSSLLRKLRVKLRGEIEFKVSKKRLIERALKETGKSDLINYLGNMPILILSNLNPFKVWRKIDDFKIKGPIKPGQIAEQDIIVPKGPTSLIPGPIIAELQQAGLKAKMEKGKIVIMEDTVFIKKGEKVSPQKARILNELGILPLDIIIKIRGAWEDGFVYPGEVLAVRPEEYIEKIKQIYWEAYNLALNANIFVKEIMDNLISKAYLEAYNLALNINYISKDTIKDLLKKAWLQAKNLEVS